MQKSEVYSVIKHANEGNEDVGVGEAQCDDGGEWGKDYQEGVVHARAGGAGIDEL